MKRAAILFSLGVILSISGYLYASEIEVESEIGAVTVYPHSALITRRAELKLKPGGHKIVFSDIIPELDESSLRVTAEGEAEVRLFGAKVKKEFLKEVPSERAKQLKTEIQRLEDEKRKLLDSKKILSEEKEFLDSMRLFSQGQLPKDLVTKIPSVEELGRTFDFLHTKLKENYSEVLETELGIRELEKKLDVLRRELFQVSTPSKKLKRSIVVDIEVLKAGSLNLKISYLVRGATWRPLYDARADFGRSQVEMVSYAIVKQSTGEDWENVEMFLSTAKPAIRGRMPYIRPWFLRPYQPQAQRAKRTALTLEKLSVDKVQYEAYSPREKGDVFPEENFAQAEEKGIAVVYELKRKATVKSDGSEHKLPIASQVLSADFKYSTYPKTLAFAYLGSRVTNAKRLQLLAGKVNIFLEGDFMGTSSIGNIGPGEEFDLYLGVDESVKVKRERLKKKVDETLIAGIPSRTKRTTFKYKLTVENYKSKKIKVRLFEAMPVSEDERIKVKIAQVSLEPTEKDWKDRKGIWLWELELEPGKKQEIFYTFSVEHPRDMQVKGL